MMTRISKMKIGITVAVLLIVLMAGIFIITLFIAPQPSHTISFGNGYYQSVQRADYYQDYIHIDLTKRINEEYSLTLENAYLGMKQILITYTLKSEKGTIPPDDMYDRIADNCKISIDGHLYERIEGSVFDFVDMRGTLLLIAGYYGNDFVLTENSSFEIIFNNLIEDIDFEFRLTEKPDFLKDQVDYTFRYNHTKYNIQSIELDTMATTLNFSRLYYNEAPDFDIKIVQNAEEYQCTTFCNMCENQHYISFPSVERGVPFDIYVGDEKIYTHTFQ